MNDLLHDLVEHQAWAGAEHWRALEALKQLVIRLSCDLKSDA